MNQALALLAFTGALSFAQNASYWKQSLSRLPETPSPSTSVEDIARFEHSMRLAAPYFAHIQSHDYDANRALARRMAAYLAGLQVLARGPQMRREVERAQHIFDSLALAPLLGYGYPPVPLAAEPAAGESAPGQPSLPLSSLAQPPFEIGAPGISGVSEAERDTARDLSQRYEASAGRAAGAWQNAETLRLSLAARGMSLNTAASTSVLRLPMYFSNAAESLRKHDWDDARTNLVRAESETEKIMKSVGR